jgi:ABC-2 type transport system permease protein
MNDAALLVHQVKYEQKAFWRNPLSAVFIFAFPVIMWLIFGTLNRHSNITQHGFSPQGLPYDQYFVAGILVYALMASCYSYLAMSVVTKREIGILKRLRGTPLPTWAMIGALIVGAVITALILTAITLTIGFAAFDVHWHGHLIALLATVLLGTLCFSALGIAMSTFVPNDDAAGPIVNILMFVLLFLSGIFFPIAKGSGIQHFAAYFPVYHLVQAIYTASFNPTTTGSGFSPHDLLVVAIWAAAGVVVALRRFRWEASSAR